MKKILFVVLFCGLMIGPKAFAIDFGERWSLGGGGWGVFPIVPENYEKSTEGVRMWTAHLKYGLVDDLSFLMSYTNILVDNKSNGLESRYQPITVGLKYHPFEQWRVSPYLVGGIGGSVNKQELSASSVRRWTDFTAHAGLGFEVFVNPGASIGIEGLYHHIQQRDSLADLGIITVAGMVNFYFGESGTTIAARKEAEMARKKAEAARAEARKQKAAAEEMLRKANAAKEQAEAAQREALEAQKAAEAARSRADQAKLAASEAQAALKQAQAELDRVKEMVATKDINPINFKSGSSELTPESFGTLDLVGEIAKKYPNLVLRVEGHTDNVGKDLYNLRLSQSRADSVKAYLVENGYLKVRQVSAVGFGESRPIADNDSPRGRALNRRVEFFFVLK